MCIAVEGYSLYSVVLPWVASDEVVKLLTKTFVGSLVYICILSLLDRELFRDLRALKTKT